MEMDIMNYLSQRSNLSVDVYHQMAELQEKLRRSEEERMKLEEKFKLLMKACREEEENRLKHLQDSYVKFLEDCSKRNDRNERILRSLDKVENGANIVFAKTERLKTLHKHYEAYLERIMPNWKQHSSLVYKQPSSLSSRSYKPPHTSRLTGSTNATDAYVMMRYISPEPRAGTSSPVLRTVDESDLGLRHYVSPLSETRWSSLRRSLTRDRTYDEQDYDRRPAVKDRFSSKEYSRPEEYIKREEFTRTKEYTRPDEYTRPAEYTKTEEYTKSDEYLRPTEYTKTEEYARPVDYTRTNEYAKPDNYIRTEEYTRPDKYTRPAKYTKTEEYTSTIDPNIVTRIDRMTLDNRRPPYYDEVVEKGNREIETRGEKPYEKEREIQCLVERDDLPVLGRTPQQRPYINREKETEIQCLVERDDLPVLGRTPQQRPYTNSDEDVLEKARTLVRSPSRSSMPRTNSDLSVGKLSPEATSRFETHMPMFPRVESVVEPQAAVLTGRETQMEKQRSGELLGDDEVSPVTRQSVLQHQKSIDKLKAALSVEEDDSLPYQPDGDIVQKDELEKNEKFAEETDVTDSSSEVWRIAGPQDVHPPGVIEPAEYSKKHWSHGPCTLSDGGPRPVGDVVNLDQQQLDGGGEVFEDNQDNYPESYFEQPPPRSQYPSNISGTVILEEDEYEVEQAELPYREQLQQEPYEGSAPEERYFQNKAEGEDQPHHEEHYSGGQNVMWGKEELQQRQQHAYEEEGQPGLMYQQQEHQMYEPDNNQIYEPENHMYPQDTGEVHEQDGNQIYEQDINQVYQQDSNQMYQHDSNEVYEQDPNQMHEQDSNQMYQQDSNQMYQQDSNQMYQHDSNEVYEQDPNQMHEQDTNQMYQHDSNEVYEQDPNQMHEQDSNQMYQQDTNQMYQQDSNQMYQHDSNEVYEQDPNQMHEQDTNQMYPQHSDQVYEQDTNQMYEQDTNQMYQQDSNPVYEQDTNRMYEHDTNQMYQHDTNPVYEQDTNQVYEEQDINEVYEQNSNQMYQQDANQVFDATGNNQEVYDSNRNEMYQQNNQMYQLDGHEMYDPAGAQVFQEGSHPDYQQQGNFDATKHQHDDGQVQEIQSTPRALRTRPNQPVLSHLLESDSESYNIGHGDVAAADDSDFDFSLGKQ